MTLQAHVVLCDMGLKHSSTSEERKLLLTSSRGHLDFQGPGSSSSATQRGEEKEKKKLKNNCTL